MNTASPVFGSVHVDLTDADARIHTIHDDGELSVDLTAGIGGFAVYLTGTPDELQWLADKLRAIVTAHESSTKLAGEAAARVAEAAVPCWCRGRDAMDPCGHADTSEGCPAHDRNARAEYLAEIDA